MGRFVVVCSVLALAVAACFFEPAKPGLHSGDAGIDGTADAIADTPTMCAAVSTDCVGDTLRTCSMVGQPGSDQVCSWGCSTTRSPHCTVMLPAGGGVGSGDLTAAFPSGALTINGGIIDTDDCSLTSDAGNYGCDHSGTVTVIRAQQITVSGAVQVIGSKPLALVSDDDLMVIGAIDLTGGCADNAAGPGGHGGSTTGAQPLGNGAGQATASSGGGGGGHGTSGGSGGEKNTSGGYGTGGIAFGDATISALEGGGGGAGGGTSGGGAGGVGGGGGGAVQLVSNHQIVVSGSINAGGCGGWGTSNGGPAGGGGAGGTILIEAPRISITGIIAANGGGGGAGDPNGGRGGTGSASTMPAMGGATSDMTTGVGGAGGAAGTEAGQMGGNAVNSGGGGGAVGRIRLETHNDQLTLGSASLSPALGTSATAGSAATL